MQSRALLLVCLVAFGGLVSGESAREKLCERVAATSDPYETDGDDCTVSCRISYLGLFKAHLDPGTACEKGAGRCVLGECREPSYKLPTRIDSYTIRIKSASVTSADEITGTDSDPFVVVTLVKGSSATYSTGTRLCRTPTLWHKAEPEWDFSCRSVELERGAVLKFSVYDMDTVRAELLGDVTRKVSQLLKSGESELKLGNSYRGTAGQTLTVEVSSRPFRLARATDPDEDDDDGDQQEQRMS